MKNVIILFVLLSTIVGNAQKMKYQSSSTRAVPGKNKIVALDIITSGNSYSLSLLSLNIKARKKNCRSVIKIYYTGTNDSFSLSSNLIDSFCLMNAPHYLSVPQKLLEGNNHFWVAFTGNLHINSFALGEQLYQQVWADEFDSDTINYNNWKFEQGFARNNELQWYQKENASCSRGILTIEARKENKVNPIYAPGAKDWRHSRDSIRITSSSMLTAGKQSWLYGRFEMRGRIDTVSGYWPAWWTLGVMNRWPSNGEIDIMEFYRGKILANIAVGTKVPSKALWYSNTKAVNSFADPLWKDKFHIWRMDWDEEGISLYVDDLLLNHQSQSYLYNRDSAGFYPFKQNQYMLLNLAIGGDNGGSIDHTTFPLKYEVDYVRVSQKIPRKYGIVGKYKPMKI